MCLILRDRCWFVRRVKFEFSLLLLLLLLLLLFWFLLFWFLLLQVSFPQSQLMVFHCSLSDSKSFQVSMTLLGILADFNNAIVWMVSDRPTIIFSFPAPLSSFWRPFRVHQLQLESPPLSSSITFLALWQDPSTCLSFCFLEFSLCGPLYRQNLLHREFSFFPLFFFCYGIWICRDHPCRRTAEVSFNQWLIPIPMVFFKKWTQYRYWSSNSFTSRTVF